MKTLVFYSPTSSLGLPHGHDVSWMRKGHEPAWLEFHSGSAWDHGPYRVKMHCLMYLYCSLNDPYSFLDDLQISFPIFPNQGLMKQAGLKLAKDDFEPLILLLLPPKCWAHTTTGHIFKLTYFILCIWAFCVVSTSSLVQTHRKPVFFSFFCF